MNTVKLAFFVLAFLVSSSVAGEPSACDRDLLESVTEAQLTEAAAVASVRMGDGETYQVLVSQSYPATIVNESKDWAYMVGVDSEKPGNGVLFVEVADSVVDKEGGHWRKVEEVPFASPSTYPEQSDSLTATDSRVEVELKEFGTLDQLLSDVYSIDTEDDGGGLKLSDVQPMGGVCCITCEGSNTTVCGLVACCAEACCYTP